MSELSILSVRDSSDTLHKIYMNWKISNYSSANSFSQTETFLTKLHVLNLYGVLPCNPPIGQILVLIPRFDRELSKHSSAAKMAPGLNSSLFSTKACITNNEHFVE